MRIDIHLFVHGGSDDKFGRILDKLDQIQKGEEKMSAELDALTAQVTANTDAEQSAITLLNNLHDLLVAAGTDPVKLAALASTLKTSRDALAAAIVANTPAA
jgi:transcriptional antiterminator